MYNYLEALKRVRDSGVSSEDRTGVGTISLFGESLRFNLKDGFPAVTTKRLAFKSVVSELLWFLEGSTNERRLAEIHYGLPRACLSEKRTIWTDNYENVGKQEGFEHGELGRVYGYQWVGQLDKVVQGIKEEPHSRRHVVNSWNYRDLHTMALPPCHYSYQFYVRDSTLSCQVTMRSGDMFLGIPFNIASYALLTHIIAADCQLEPGQLIINIGDAHIYKNHLEQVEEQLSRTPYRPPELEILDSPQDIFRYSVDSFRLKGYNSHPLIKAVMAA